MRFELIDGFYVEDNNHQYTLIIGNSVFGKYESVKELIDDFLDKKIMTLPIQSAIMALAHSDGLKEWMKEQIEKGLKQ